MEYETNTIERYLKTKAGNKNTYSNYKSQLNRYFKTIKKNPERYIPKDIRKFENGDKVDLEDRLIKDIKNYAEKVKDCPKKTQMSLFNVVKKYLEYFYIDLPTREWENLKSTNGIKKVRSETPKKTPTVDDLKYILRGATVKQKALISLATSTGLRAKELVSIKLKDIDWENRSIIILSKGDYYRIVFFTEETKELLQQWLEQREDYIKDKWIKSLYVRKNKKKNIKDFLFPFTKNTAQVCWNNLIEKAGSPYNEKVTVNKNKRYVYNFHCLRRFFESQLHNTGIDGKHYDAISGHISNLNQEYVEVTQHREEKALARKKSYDNNSSVLNVFSDYEKAKSELGSKQETQQRMLLRLQDENEILKDEIKNLKEMNLKEQTDSHFAKQQTVDSEKTYQKQIDELKDQIQDLVKIINQK